MTAWYDWVCAGFILLFLVYLIIRPYISKKL